MSARQASGRRAARRRPPAINTTTTTETGSTLTIERARAAAAAMPADDSPAARLITRRDVLDRVPISYPALWAAMRAGTFPRSRQVGGRALWIEAEINAWILALPIKPLLGEK
jgi:prophage regulatory protein